MATPHHLLKKRGNLKSTQIYTADHQRQGPRRRSRSLRHHPRHLLPPRVQNANRPQRGPYRPLYAQRGIRHPRTSGRLLRQRRRRRTRIKRQQPNPALRQTQPHRARKKRPHRLHQKPRQPLVAGNPSHFRKTIPKNALSPQTRSATTTSLSTKKILGVSFVLQGYP